MYDYRMTEQIILDIPLTEDEQQKIYMKEAVKLANKLATQKNPGLWLDLYE